MSIPRRSRARGGFINTVEFLLYAPLLLFTLLVIVQFCLVLAADARLAGASREGARVAATGGNGAQITNAVDALLLPAERSKVTIQTNAVDSAGNALDLNPGVDVVVRVSIKTKDIVPHPLALVISGHQELVGQTVMRKE
jgi:Flp pilus assembly protein TadG